MFWEISYTTQTILLLGHFYTGKMYPICSQISPVFEDVVIVKGHQTALTSHSG